MVYVFPVQPQEPAPCKRMRSGAQRFWRRSRNGLMSPSLWEHRICASSRASVLPGRPCNRVFAGPLRRSKWLASTRGKKEYLSALNHEGITQNADVCIELVHRLDSPYFGINLDVTNFIATPQADAYAQIEATLPYATHSHIRDVFENGQAVDLDRVWSLFARAN